MLKHYGKKPCYRELDIKSHDRNQMIKQVCDAFHIMRKLYGIKTKQFVGLLGMSVFAHICICIYITQYFFTLTVGTFECPQCNIQISIT